MNTTNPSTENKTNTARQKLLASYGLSAERCASVNYDFFRQAVAGISSPQLKTYRGNTFIFDQRNKSCALIKPPYFDAQGHCQPVRYFWLEGIQQSGPALRAYQRWSALDLKTVLQAQLAAGKKLPAMAVRVAQQIIATVKHQQVGPERRGVTVWTTLRLTA